MTDRDVARMVGNLVGLVVCALIFPWSQLHYFIEDRRRRR
jgi:hypothetical protein